MTSSPNQSTNTRADLTQGYRNRPYEITTSTQVAIPGAIKGNLHENSMSERNKGGVPDLPSDLNCGLRDLGEVQYIGGHGSIV
jgi:hypothetical protein